MTDSQRLLAEYARSGSDAAFRELVNRYVDLVYSTALRLVEGDTHWAEDISQTVFVDLARVARTLSSEVMLGGWLHRHTCYVAANTLRGERRRQSRERQAMEMNALQADSNVNLTMIAPILDEAINELAEADRTAILLRFFERRDFRAVGELLGSTEDAARMRVTRALEKLQSLLKRRGVTTTAAGLSVVLAANAVQAAPVGLAVTLSTGALAGTSIAAAATATVTKTITMTALQKTIIGATLAAAVGTGIYEARQATNSRAQVQTLQQQQAPLAEQIQQLRQERDDATNKLAALRDENERLNRNADKLLKLRGEVARLRAGEQQAGQLKTMAASSNDPFTRSVLALTSKAGELNQFLTQMPDKSIPELQYLSAADWLTAAKDADLQTDVGIRRALANLRRLAKSRFVPLATRALDNYLKANDGQLPADPSQLKPYFKVPVDDITLQRYRMLQTGNVKDLPTRNTPIMTEKAPVDRDYDSHFYLTLGGSSYYGTGKGETGDPDATWATRQ